MNINPHFGVSHSYIVQGNTAFRRNQMHLSHRSVVSSLSTCFRPILFVSLFLFHFKFISSGSVTRYTFAKQNWNGRKEAKENRLKVFRCSVSSELLLRSNSTINWKTCLFYDCINFSLIFLIRCVRSPSFTAGCYYNFYIASIGL